MICVRGAKDAIVLGLLGVAETVLAALPDLRLRKRDPFLSAARRPDEAPRRVENAILCCQLHGHFAQHLESSDAGGDLAQRRDRGFILGFEARLVALSQFARTLSGGESHVEPIGNFLKTIFDGNACHS